jgi:predicted ATP-dependent protease
MTNASTRLLEEHDIMARELRDIKSYLQTLNTKAKSASQLTREDVQSIVQSIVDSNTASVKEWLNDRIKSASQSVKVEFGSTI